MSYTLSPEEWKERKRLSREKRAYNREHSPKFLDECGVKYDSKHNGSFLYVYPGIWFWPGTGSWKVPGTMIYGRGVKSLVRYIQNTQPPGDTQTGA